MESQKVVFFAQRPEITRLCHVVLKVLTEPTPGFQTQILKCRQLLCLSRDILAYPRENDRTIVDVVVTCDFYKSSMASLCHKLQLKPLHASIAKNFSLEQCLRYTVKFRLSSEWSHAGDLFLNHPNFLQSSSKMDAISAEINVSEREIVFQLSPSLVRLPPPQLEDFAICPDTLEDFRSDAEKCRRIPEVAINVSWCHILPSMRKGQVVAISRDLKLLGSSSTMLQDFAGVKKYWKTHYGYDLRESEDALFCSIYFMRIPHQLFTYPLACVRTKNFQHFPRCDSTAIIQNFFSHIRHKFNEICGIPISYSANPASLHANLTKAIQLKSGSLSNTKLAKLPPTQNTTKKEKSAQFTNLRKVPESNSDVVVATQMASSSEQLVPCSSKISKLPKTAEGRFIPTFGAKNTVKIKNKTVSVTATKEDISNRKVTTKKTVEKKNKKASCVSANLGCDRKVPIKNHQTSASGASKAKSNQDKTQARKSKAAFSKITKNSKTNPEPQCYEEDDFATKRQLPPAKMSSKKMKTHNFDQMFSSAATNYPQKQVKQHDNNQILSSTGGKPPRKKMKKHNFDNLFSSASNPSGDTVERRPSLSLKMKKHNFESLFSSATNCSSKEQDKNNLAFSKSFMGDRADGSGYKKLCLFDQLFSSANDA